MADEKKYKVAIVDDDRFLLNMYSLKLEKESIEVETIESGEDLLDRLKEGYRPDLILLDVIIPGLDGLELLAKIKNEKLAEGVKVAMLTNQSDPEEIKKAESLGAVGYIIKASAVPSEVVEKIKGILSKK